MNALVAGSCSLGDISHGRKGPGLSLVLDVAVKKDYGVKTGYSTARDKPLLYHFFVMGWTLSLGPKGPSVSGAAARALGRAEEAAAGKLAAEHCWWCAGGSGVGWRYADGHRWCRLCFFSLQDEPPASRPALVAKACPDGCEGCCPSAPTPPLIKRKLKDNGWKHKKSK
jgi:hypothetical protein